MCMEAGYGYEGKLEEILQEYTFNGTYLDNAAAPLVAKSVALKSAEYLASNQLVNPHSKSYWSTRTLEMVNETRKQVLDLLGTNQSDFDLVFTANATAALKLIGECMAHHNFVYLKDSHTSVVGLRSYAKTYRVSHDIGAEILGRSWIACWPLQSNFDGKRYPTEWISSLTNSGALSIVDLSAFCATGMPKLDEWPDMAVLSFYKIFGLPDLGGLLVRKSERVNGFLRSRKYAGGGTVSSLAPELDYMVRSEDICTSLEDGTLPFHSIAMLKCAMEEFKRIYGSFDRIAHHTRALQRYCFRGLESTGLCSMVSRYDDVGPIVTFSVKNAGYHEFSNVCNKLDIHVRVGTLCNVGAFTIWSGMTDKQLIHNHQVLGKTCSDELDNLNGEITGVVRVSFGPYTTKANIDKLIECVITYFGKQGSLETSTTSEEAEIVQLIVYPIKSCGGLKISTSAVFERGLEWDRAFCLVDPETLKVFSLKKHLMMAHIHTVPSNGTLHISYFDQTIRIPMDVASWQKTMENDVAFCGPRSSDLTVNGDPAVRQFFTAILGVPCTLAKITDHEARHSATNSSRADIPLSLSNSSPILLISTTSAQDLEDTDYEVFRANIVVKSKSPWVEDTWNQIRIGNGTYNLLGPCRRCNMVCVTKDGKSDHRPYLALTKKRRYNGKIWFGQHMQTHCLETPSFSLSIGDQVHCISKKPVDFSEYDA